jgi:hypothetical protein
MPAARRILCGREVKGSREQEAARGAVQPATLALDTAVVAEYLIPAHTPK